MSHISQYEQVGNYIEALSMARATFSNDHIPRLEKSVLEKGFTMRLFDEKLMPRVKLMELLKIAGMEGIGNNLIDINSWAQNNLLRQGERWEAQSTKFEELKPRIKPLLQELGYLDAVKPSFKTYDGAIVNGALLPRVRLRIAHLVEIWKQGIKFPHIYFLSGDRPLDAKLESKELLASVADSQMKIRPDWKIPEKFPEKEWEMMQMVWEQLDIPQEMRDQVKVYFINAPMKVDPKTGQKTIRPSTEDTFEYWLKENPNKGNYLTISNAPFISRQDVVSRTLSPKEFGFDTVGVAVSEQEKVAIILDEVGRGIFQTIQWAKKMKLLQ